MTKQKISVTRALAMAKSLNAKIGDASTAAFVGVSVGKGANTKPLGSVGTVAALSSSFQGNYDTVRALIRQRQAIKAAVVISNATTKLTLSGKEMTVAEAIELKGSVEQKRTLLGAMQAQVLRSGAIIAQQNTTMQSSIDKLLETAAGGDKAKADDAGGRQIAALQSDMKEAALIDPINISAAIEALKKEIESIDLELDFTLSEINAKTEIEVDLTA